MSSTTNLRQLAASGQWLGFTQNLSTETSAEQTYLASTVSLLSQLAGQELTQGQRTAFEAAIEKLTAAFAEGHAALPISALSAASIEALQASSLVTCNTSPQSSLAAGTPGRVLTLEAGFLAFTRLRNYEVAVAKRLLELDTPSSRFDPEMEACIRQHAAQANLSSEQLQAVLLAASRKLAVITGGPGTGKTTCLATLIAALREARPQLRLALAAPTGKAAQRMRSALSSSCFGEQILMQVNADHCISVDTLHSILGIDPSSGRARHHAGRPLAFDCVVVDEASMMDLAMAAKLLDALPQGAQLLMLGDKDQLSAVEVGRVFHSLCGSASQPPPLPHAVATLHTSWRFDASSLLGAAATAVRNGDAQALSQVVARAQAPRGTDSSFSWHTVAQTGGNALELLLMAQLQSELEDYTAALRRDARPEEVLALCDQWQVLCLMHGGPFGVQRANRLIGRYVRQHAPGAVWGQHYHGQRIMLTRNQPQELGGGLSNGDIGVVLRTQGHSRELRELRVWFATPTGLQSWPVVALGPVVDAFAMTVHKSQGSEYDRVVLLLPGHQEPGRLASRELLYTAMTRGKSHMVVIAECADASRAWAPLHQSENGSSLAQRLMR
jgi:exodeoxyribonuclease V alpha subunit